MLQPKRSIELRRGLVLDPHPSPIATQKFQSFERTLRELEAVIGNRLTISYLRSLLPSWISPSRLDDRQVIHQIATMVAHGSMALVSWPMTELFEAGRQLSTKLAAPVAAKSCKCFNPSAFAKALDTNTKGRTASIGLCGRYVGFALAAGGATAVGFHNGGDYGPFLIQAGFAMIPATDYVPQAGDVVIFKPTSTHTSGHAAGYDGKQWVSDFLQSGPNPYRIKSSAGTQTFYRIACKCSL